MTEAAVIKLLVALAQALPALTAPLLALLRPDVALEAKRLGVWPYDDPRSMLQRIIVEGRLTLKGEKSELAELLAYAEHHLMHVA